MLISFRNTFTDQDNAIMFDQMSGDPMTQASWHFKWTVTAGVNNEPGSRPPALAAEIPASVPLSIQGIQLQGLLSSFPPEGNAVLVTVPDNDEGTSAATAWACCEDWMRLCVGTYYVSCSVLQRWRAVIILLFFLGIISIHIIFMFSRPKWKDNVSEKLSPYEFIKRD